MVKILTSLIITAIISTLIGLLSSKFIVGFILATILQFIIFYIGNTIYNNYIITKIETIKLAQFKQLEKKDIVVSCPCAESNKQIIDINVNESLVYNCNKCGKNIRAVAEVQNYITTQPIYFHDRTPKDNNGS